MRTLALPAVLLALGLALAGCGADRDEPATAPPPAPAPATTAVAEPAPECSTAGLRIELEAQPGLPAAVAEKRAAIFRAAVACDYDALAALASPGGFTYSYGDSGDPAAHWRRLEAEGADGERPLAVLATILALPHARNEAGDYTWPSAHQERPSEEDWDLLVEAGVATRAGIESMKADGSGYRGYRAGITEAGAWGYFVAGD